ncbi:MAG: DUF4465 domain-containing protein [Planctomycetota bacterium]
MKKSARISILANSTFASGTWSIAVVLSAFLMLQSQVYGQTTVIDFESLPVPETGFFNGDVNGTSPFRDNFRITGTRDNFGEPETLQLWSIGGVEFFNGYTEAFGSWNGFSWSNVVDPTTPGFANQYASVAGGGSDGSGSAVAGENYILSFSEDFSYFNLPELGRAESIDITNSTWAALAMRDGDGPSKKFGGPTGDDEDFFKITFTGYSQTDKTGAVTGAVEFLLADYRFEDNSLDYIVNQWTQVDLTGVGDARSIALTMESTDVNNFGIATPVYAALDNLTFTSVPEPTATAVILAAMAIFTGRRRRSS